MVAELLADPPRPSRRRPGAAALQGVAVVLLLVAGLLRVAWVTSNDTGIAIRPALVAAAPGAARAQRTAHGDLTITVKSSFLDTTMTQVAPFQVDFANGSSAMDLDLGAISSPAGVPRRTLLITRGTRAWLKLPPDRVAANGGRQWVATDVAATPGVSTDLTSDPAATLDRLALAGGDVLETGRETVRGVRTVRYHVEIPVEKLLASVAQELRAEARQAFENASIEAVGFDAWIDGDGLPRRLTNTVAPGGLTFTMQIEMFDYGQPVSIAIPPASDTVEVADMTAALTAAGAAMSGLAP